jgi:uncharacterized membrane protein
VRFQAEATIDRPAGDIWAYAADILRHPDWMSVTDARIHRGDGTQVGALGQERLQLGPFGWDVKFEVIEADPARRLVWRSGDGAPFDLEVRLDLEAVDPATTRATYTSVVGLPGRWRLIAPLVAMEGASGVRRELGRLKENVETASAVAPAT